MSFRACIDGYLNKEEKPVHSKTNIFHQKKVKPINKVAKTLFIKFFC